VGKSTDGGETRLREIIVDNFAGGGGASTGIELAIGRDVDIAINHDEAAIAMHKANHPGTEHYCENVWEVDPVKACRGRPVALAWFSPDCKHFSKAKGGKPVDKNIRGLAWVAVKWAKAVHPRVIILENVEEFKTWGPLMDNNCPDPERKGETFNLFIKALQKYGYKVDWRELRACDYGAPTIRKRFFLVARCDGQKIVWPEPTHGDPECLEVRCGLKKPWRTAAEIIDWSIPCPSIFDRKKPLAENTLRRIGRGIQKFVIDNPEPFIVQVNHSGASWDYCNSINRPLATVTAKHGFGLVAPVISQIGQTGGGDRLHDIQEPLSTIVSKAEHMLVTPFLTQYHSYDDNARGQTVDKPILTIDTSNRYGLVTSHIIQMNNHCDGRSLTEPLNTIVAGPGHLGEVRTFLMSYYGNNNDIGQRLNEPLRTITSKDRFGIVMVKGQDYQIHDICMRMLEPRELFNAQGFPGDYIIGFKNHQGRPYPKSSQVARCGNSVSPVIPEALIRVNLPDQCQETEVISQIG
jgi:DNA (cytosine-5)-methyltransferase 1